MWHGCTMSPRSKLTIAVADAPLGFAPSGLMLIRRRMIHCSTLAQ
jgi:hypothetical protein